MLSPPLVCKAGTEAKTLSKCITKQEFLISRFSEFIFKYISYVFSFSFLQMPFLFLPLGRQLQECWGQLPFLACAQPRADGKVAPRHTGWERVKAPLGSISCCLEQAVWDLCRNMETLCPKASVLSPLHLPLQTGPLLPLCAADWKRSFKLVLLLSLPCFSLTWNSPTSHLLPLREAWFTGAKSWNNWVSIIPWLHPLVVSKSDERSKATDPSRRAASHDKCHFHPGDILTKSVCRRLHSTSGALHPFLQWQIWCLGAARAPDTEELIGESVGAARLCDWAACPFRLKWQWYPVLR